MASGAGVVVFDVNETLLDLAALDPVFLRIFGDDRARGEWFGQVLQAALVLTAIGRYRDFVEVAGGALDLVAARRGVAVSEDDRAEVAATMRSLPAHPDVVPGLERLADAGLRLAALTNSPPAAADAQLRTAGLAPFFERILTVGPVRRFKPAGAVYEAAAAELGVAPTAMTMVAAHDWDVAGAMAAGCRGVLVLRPGVVVNPLYPEPDLTAATVGAAAELLVESGGV